MRHAPASGQVNSAVAAHHTDPFRRLPERYLGGFSMGWASLCPDDEQGRCIADFQCLGENHETLFAHILHIFLSGASQTPRIA